MGLSQAGKTEEALTEKYDTPIRRYEKNIQKLQSGIELHLGKLQISGEREFSLLGDLESIDKKLGLQKIRLQVMEERLILQKELLITKTRDLKNARKKKEETTRHLEERLRAFYLMGETGILNVTFSSRTLPELMLFNDSFQRLLDYDKSLLKRYRETITQLELATKSHAEESALLAEYIDNATKVKAELDQTRHEKAKLLSRVKSEKGLYEKALEEMQKAEFALRRSITEMQKKRTYLLEGFELKKGDLPPPVNGRIVSRFGTPLSDNKDSPVASSGLTIDVKDGSYIYSIFAGRVIFAGYQRGYGNMVIIDHGMSYYSITSRMESILVKKGDIIDEKAVIGRAGDIATLFEKGLYFEIRHGTDPVDPLAWISSKGLSG